MNKSVPIEGKVSYSFKRTQLPLILHRRRVRTLVGIGCSVQGSNFLVLVFATDL